MPEHDQLSPQAGAFPERRLAPAGAAQGLSLEDLAGASEAVWNRGWEAACVALQEEFDHRLEVAEKVLTAERVERVRAAEERGYFEGRERGSGDVAEELREAPYLANGALSLLNEVLATLPASTSTARRAAIGEAVSKLRKVSRDLDRAVPKRLRESRS